MNKPFGYEAKDLDEGLFSVLGDEKSHGRASAVLDSVGLLNLAPLEKAFVLAARLHANQARKSESPTDKANPYLSHLLAVASFVMGAGGSQDEVIAGLLHDAVEDQDVDVAQIERMFGAGVAEIVEKCTDVSSGDEAARSAENSAERKKAHREKLATEPNHSVRLVAAADKLHNARSTLDDFRRIGDEIWGRFNVPKQETLEHYRHLADIFTTGPHIDLAPELGFTVKELLEAAGEAAPPGQVTVGVQETDADRTEPPTAIFHCASCGETAATVRLLGESEDDPRFSSTYGADVPAGVGAIGEEFTRLSIEGGPIAATHALIGHSASQVLGALRRQDARALSYVDREFAPFFCGTCGLSYCRVHWETEDEWDGPFYDCTYGTCPQGHRTKIAD